MQEEMEGRMGYAVNRVLLLSPLQSELAKRSGSRIFLLTKGDNLIDSILFQSQRPMENYVDVASRAIALSRLQPINGELTVRPTFNPAVADGLLQQHLVTNTWLVDEDREAYDLYIEIEPQGFEKLNDPGYMTMNAQSIEGVVDNPLIFIAGVENLGPEHGGDFMERLTPLQPEAQPVAQDTNENSDRIPGARGRVKNPEEDGRLKQNRQPEMTSARRAQTSDDSDNQDGRMAGRPGRVKAPALDFRRKDLRQIAGAAAAGR